MKNKIILAFVLLWTQQIFAQTDTIELMEATLSDSHLLRFSQTQSTLFLSDSLLDRNPASLTGLLNFNSTIYFKENGAGMVSSPSFRGTTSQQTAVIWNGININSQLNGQTDFNTINIRGFDNVRIKPGGGSVAYGSSAIGGSIHLNNDLSFGKGLSGQLLVNYGSFNSYGINPEIDFSNDKLNLNVIFSRVGSDNDYDYIGRNQKNTNGQYYNNDLNISAGYKFSSNNILKFYSHLYDGERHFSVPTPGATKTKYHDYNTRSLVEWNVLYGKFISKLRWAYLSEKYQYYPNINSDFYEFGKVNTWIAKYDLGVYLSRNLFLNAIFDFTEYDGSGSKISSNKRQIGSGSLWLKHKINGKFLYELSLKQEVTSEYKSPLLYSLGFVFDPFHFYRINFNASKNFMIPSFNDLYWVGNETVDLKPESSYQAEIGNEIHLSKFSVKVTFFYNSIRDMIRWIPQSDGMWRPENTEKVQIYGVESYLNYKKQIQKHHFELNATYAYTVSENELIEKQLIYVPFHKATASIGYSWKRISAYYQFLFNGKVFTDTDNQDEISSYQISNLGAEYGFGEFNQFKIGFQVINLLNENYQSTLNRPMPGTNFNAYVNFKF